VLGVSEHDAALGFLRAPNLLQRILTDFEACGLVGETTNKLVAYLAVVSRKLNAPLAVLVQSSSAAGKSSLMDAVIAFVPEEERVRYSALTGQALFYMGANSLKHRILAISEEEGASRAAYALKLLQSEGELTIASTAKDADTGAMITQEYRVEGPVMLFLTTTAISIDEELMNRCLVLSVDEGRAQTEAIHRLQRRKRTLEGLRARAAKDEIIALHRNAQRLLRPLAVVNPYADRLGFLSSKTRTRRDHEKYLTLIDAIALLHQHQREVKRLVVGTNVRLRSSSFGGQASADVGATVTDERVIDYVEVTLEDIEAANGLAHEVLGRSLDELPPQTRTLLDRIATMVKERAEAQQIARSEIRFTRRQLRELTGASDTPLKVHLGRLIELEFVLVHRAERGQGHVYELLYDGDGSSEPHLSGLIDVAALASLSTYDAQRSGVKGERSAPGPGAVGLRSGGGPGTKIAETSDASNACAESSGDTVKTHILAAEKTAASYKNGASYAHASSSLAASSK
jgi:post-segregation antitoxin (ccd killing protein)